MGAILMPQALLAAYKTVPESFQIHHFGIQFFHAGAPELCLTFKVIRTNESKNNATRLVHLSQSGKRIATVVASFIRKPLNDGLWLSYQPAMPAQVDEPDDTIDDMKYLAQGLLHAQWLDMVISE
jgi:acyl-CoA thioesterase II